jgi:mono/diheme cytochrome c family protein
MSTPRVLAFGVALLTGAVLAACGSKAAPAPASPEPAAEATPVEQPPADSPPSAEHAGHEGAEPAPSAQQRPAPATHDPAQVKADLLAAELAAFEAAKPVFEKNCARCHQAGGAKAKPKMLKHFDITTYPFGGHHADEASKTVRKVLGIGGGKPTMPADKKGTVQGDELALIAAWADAFDKAHAGGAHADRGHGEHGTGHKH